MNFNRDCRFYTIFLIFIVSVNVACSFLLLTSRNVNIHRVAVSRTEAVPRCVITCLAPHKSTVGKSKVALKKSLSLAQPKQETAKPATDGAKGKPKLKRVTDEQECPRFKVLLLGDEGYEREHVVMAIQEIIPEADNVKSAEIFEEAQKTGTGMCGVYPEEHAELYVQQFIRCEPMIFADMEKE